MKYLALLSSMGRGAEASRTGEQRGNNPHDARIYNEHYIAWREGYDAESKRETRINARVIVKEYNGRPQLWTEDHKILAKFGQAGEIPMKDAQMIADLLNAYLGY